MTILVTYTMLLRFDRRENMKNSYFYFLPQENPNFLTNKRFKTIEFSSSLMKIINSWPWIFQETNSRNSRKVFLIIYLQARVSRFLFNLLSKSLQETCSFCVKSFLNIMRSFISQIMIIESIIQFKKSQESSQEVKKSSQEVKS